MGKAGLSGSEGRPHAVSTGHFKWFNLSLGACFILRILQISAISVSMVCAMSLKTVLL